MTSTKPAKKSETPARQSPSHVKLQKLDAADSRMILTEKLAAVGELAGGVAHEINTPLGAILLSAQCLRHSIETGKFTKEYGDKMLQSIEDTAQQIAKIVRSLRTYSRESTSGPHLDVKLVDLVEGVLSLCQRKLINQGVDIHFAPDELRRIIIQCRETEIGQILLNLLKNAADAIETLDEKWIRISAKTDQGFADIIISDSGNGIAKEQEEAMFKPFMTSKELGKGTGLGLSISRNIAEGHHGKLFVDHSCENTCFVLRLPLIQTMDDESLAESG
jgi:C4-dicarboxylate-specific signal transduction histidine kinase